MGGSAGCNSWYSKLGVMNDDLGSFCFWTTSLDKKSDKSYSEISKWSSVMWIRWLLRIHSCQVHQLSTQVASYPSPNPYLILILNLISNSNLNLTPNQPFPILSYITMIHTIPSAEAPLQSVTTGLLPILENEGIYPFLSQFHNLADNIRSARLKPEFHRANINTDRTVASFDNEFKEQWIMARLTLMIPLDLLKSILGEPWLMIAMVG